MRRVRCIAACTDIIWAYNRPYIIWLILQPWWNGPVKWLNYGSAVGYPLKSRGTVGGVSVRNLLTTVAGTIHISADMDCPCSPYARWQGCSELFRYARWQGPGVLGVIPLRTLTGVLGVIPICQPMSCQQAADRIIDTYIMILMRCMIHYGGRAPGEEQQIVSNHMRWQDENRSSHKCII